MFTLLTVVTCIVTSVGIVTAMFTLLTVVTCIVKSVGIVTAMEVTYEGNGKYSVSVNGDKFIVNNPSLVKTGNKNILTCEIGGHVTRLNVVLDGDTLNMFTVVRTELIIH